MTSCLHVRVCIELDEDDMVLMAEANGGEVKSKEEAVKENKKDEEPLPDYDAVVAADVEGRSLNELTKQETFDKTFNDVFL